MWEIKCTYLFEKVEKNGNKVSPLSSLIYLLFIFMSLVNVVQVNVFKTNPKQFYTTNIFSGCEIKDFISGSGYAEPVKRILTKIVKFS